MIITLTLPQIHITPVVTVEIQPEVLGDRDTGECAISIVDWTSAEDIEGDLVEMAREQLEEQSRTACHDHMVAEAGGHVGLGGGR